MKLEFLVTRPVAVISTVIGLILISVAIIGIIPVSLLPETAIPRITVQINHPTLSAVELENTIVKTVRRQLLQLDHLQDINSVAYDGYAVIDVDFEFGTNTDLSFIEVNEKIDQSSNLLPQGFERPRVLKASVTDIPVFYLSVVGRQHELLELSDFTRDVLKRRIEQLPQVAFVDISGTASPEIMIRPKTAKMTSMGLNEQDLETILQNNSIDLGQVVVQDGHYQYHVRFLSPLSSREDIEQLVFRHEDKIIRLGELVSVELGAGQQRGSYLFDDQQSIVLAVRKQADAQLFSLRRAFEQLLESLQADYPTLKFHLSNDQSELLEISIGNLRTSLLFGAIFAMLIMLLFHKDWKGPLLIMTSIPVALIISILGFYLLDLSINIISLSGLILGVGLMIDNAIIVNENIQQYRELGYNWTTSCVQGANEVIQPLISSMLTTCSVFLPLIFLSGLAGALFFDQAVSITIALGISLLVAYIFLPTLTCLLGSKLEVANVNTESTSRPFKFPDNRYTRCVDHVLKRKYFSLLMFVALLAAGGLIIPRLPVQTFPELTRQAISLRIDWNEPIGLPENESRVRQLINTYRRAIVSSNAFIGEQQFLLEQNRQAVNQAELHFVLRQPAREVIQNVKARFHADYPNASIVIEPLKNIFDNIFGNEKAPLILHLQERSSDSVPTPAAVSPVVAYLKGKGLSVNPPPLQEKYTLEILRDKAILYEVPYDNIFRQLETLFNNNQAGFLKTSFKHIPMVIGSDETELFRKIENGQVLNNKAQLLPLQTFIRFQRGQDYKFITAGKSGNTVNLDIPVYDATLPQDLRHFLHLYTGLTGSFSGQEFDDQKVAAELLVVLGISFLLLYLILVAQFESLIQPVIVMLSVPIGVAGALLLLWWSGESLNLVSLIGLIVMSGIVVNDAILKVDMINRLRRSYSLKHAIHGAGMRRLKPIIMTSLTTILALSPILFASGLGAELQRPLVYTVIGGLFLGTFNSLFFIPLIYSMIYGHKESI